LIAATTVRIDAFREPEIIDALHVLERAMHHFFIWVEIGKTRTAKNEQVDEDYKQAAALAALVTPYRHARLSAMKLADVPNNSVHMISDDLTADELRAEVPSTSRS